MAYESETYGPDMTRVAALIGDPCRSLMLNALMGGQALTASELATEGGVTKQTASSHLRQMLEGGLLTMESQGRHRYYRLANADIAHLLEALVTVASANNNRKVRPGPRDERLRLARTCYDHMAGEKAVTLFDGLIKRNYLSLAPSGDGQTPIQINEQGRQFLSEFGIEIEALEKLRRPLCRTCLDWSARKPHLSGALGAALLTRFHHLDWVRTSKTPRLLSFTQKGNLKFKKLFE